MIARGAWLRLMSIASEGMAPQHIAGRGCRLTDDQTMPCEWLIRNWSAERIQARKQAFSHLGHSQNRPQAHESARWIYSV